MGPRRSSCISSDQDTDRAALEHHPHHERALHRSGRGWLAPESPEPVPTSRKLTVAFGILDLTGCLVPMARTGRGVTLWSFLAEEVTPFMVSAIRVFGLEVLAAEDEGMALPDQEAVGRELLRLVFDARDGGPELPAVLTDLIADPDNEAAATSLTGRLFQTFKADPGMTSAAAAMIARFYRRQADGGDVQALLARPGRPLVLG